MTYRCKECGEIFDEPMIVRNNQGCTSAGAIMWETFCVCPNCGEGSYEEYNEDEEYDEDEADD